MITKVYPKWVTLLYRCIVPLAALIIIAVPLVPDAFEWHIANQVTVAWDAVTDRSDGTPLPTGDGIEYVVYTANELTDPDKQNIGDPVWTGTATEATLTMAVEGSFMVGVRAIRMVDGVNVGESDISWSDNPAAVSDEGEFGLRYWLPPGIPGGIKSQ